MLDRTPKLLLLVALFVGVALIATGAVLQHRRETAAERELGDTRADLEAACEDGEAASCYDAGMMWGKGEGGPKDHARARDLVQRACDAGHEEACSFLPMMR